MDRETVNALKWAAKLIREGDTQAARSVIVNILREEPDNAQAWLMLSYAVPKIEKQIYALQQALRVAPGNEKALRRIKKLGGEPPFAESEENTELDDKSSQSDGPDLLSQRLFDAPDDPAELKPPDQPARTPPFVEEGQGVYDDSEYVFDEEKKSIGDSLKKLQTDIYESEKIKPIDSFLEKTIARMARIPPRVYITSFLAIVLVVLGIIYVPRIYQMISSSNIAQFIRESITGEDGQLSNAIVATPTESPPSPTPNPSPTPVVIPLFNISDLSPASGGVRSEMEGVTTGLNTLIGYAPESAPEIYAITESRLQDFAWDFAQLDGYEELVEDAQIVFQILGVARDTDDFATFYQNIWIDPNGTLYQPENNFIAAVGFEFSNYQKVSFAQAYVQSIRNRQTSFADSGFFPPCIFPTEACEVRMALVKGEAAFTAGEWAQQTFDEGALEQISETNKKYYLVPVLSPTTLMEDIRRFPYDQGKAFAEQIYRNGGWATVQALYINLPQSTEQILHPEKYLAGETGESVEYTSVQGIFPETWQMIYDGPLGEWKTYLIFKDTIFPNARLDAATAQSAAAGWNGDHAQIMLSESGQRLMVGHWKWDTIPDAAEFDAVLRNYTAFRVGGTEVVLAGNNCIQSNLETSCVISKGQDVLWILSQDATLVESVIQNYAFLNAE